MFRHPRDQDSHDQRDETRRQVRTSAIDRKAVISRDPAFRNQERAHPRQTGEEGGEKFRERVFHGVQCLCNRAARILHRFFQPAQHPPPLASTHRY